MKHVRVSKLIRKRETHNLETFYLKNIFALWLFGELTLTVFKKLNLEPEILNLNYDNPSF